MTTTHPAAVTTHPAAVTTKHSAVTTTHPAAVTTTHPAAVATTHPAAVTTTHPAAVTTTHPAAVTTTHPAAVTTTHPAAVTTTHLAAMTTTHPAAVTTHPAAVTTTHPAAVTTTHPAAMTTTRPTAVTTTHPAAVTTTHPAVVTTTHPAAVTTTHSAAVTTTHLLPAVTTTHPAAVTTTHSAAVTTTHAAAVTTTHPAAVTTTHSAAVTTTHLLPAVTTTHPAVVTTTHPAAVTTTHPAAVTTAHPAAVTTTHPPTVTTTHPTTTPPPTVTTTHPTTTQPPAMTTAPAAALAQGPGSTSSTSTSTTSTTPPPRSSTASTKTSAKVLVATTAEPKAATSPRTTIVVPPNVVTTTHAPAATAPATTHSPPPSTIKEPYAPTTTMLPQAATTLPATAAGLTTVALAAVTPVMRAGVVYNFTLTVASGRPVECNVSFGDHTNATAVKPELQTATLIQRAYATTFSGAVTITTVCSDGSHTAAASVSAIVQLPLAGVTVITTPTTVAVPPGLVNVTMSFAGDRYENQTLLVVLDMGDGTVLRQNFTNTMNMSDVTFFQYYYNVTGVTIPITVNISNAVSQLSFVNPITTSRKLSGGKLTVAKSRLLVTDVATLQLALLSDAKVQLVVYYGDNYTENYIAAVSVNFTHRYTEAGNYSVFVIASNSVSIVNITCDQIIQVKQNMNSIIFNAPSIVALPGGSYTLTMSSPYIFTAVTCKYDLGGISSTVTYPLISTEDTSIQFNLSSLAPGQHNAFVDCQDGSSNVSHSSTMLALQNITSLDMFVSNNITQVGNNISVFLSVNFGSNISFVVSCGDGNLELKHSGFQTSHTFTYSYSTIGSFMIRGSAANPLSTVTKSALISVLEPLKGVTFHHYSIDLYSGRVFQGTGSNQNKYNLVRQLLVSTNVTSGNNLKYTWVFVIGNSIDTFETQTGYFAKMYYNACNVTITCTVTNGVDNVTGTLHVEMQDPVTISSFTNDGPKISGKNITYTLNISKPSPSTCILMSMPNSTMLYGSVECPDIFKSSSFTDTSYVFSNTVLTTSVNFTVNYPLEGSFSAEATLFNWVSRSFAQSQVAITRAECKYPTVNIFGSGLDVEAPMVTFASQQVVVEGSAVLNCQFSNRAQYTWAMYRTVHQTGAIGAYTNYLVNDTLNGDPTQLLRSVVLPSYSLQPGTLYNISLTVVMLDMPQIYSTTSMFIYVKTQPLHLVFVGGTEISVGYNKDYSIDVVSLSMDPDADPSSSSSSSKSSWQYSWLCYRDEEPAPDLTAALVTVPTDMSNITIYSDKGGCFGTGPGRLMVPDTQGVLQMNTNYSPVNALLVFRVIVTTPTKTGQAEYRVQVSSGDPPPLIFRCISNCLAFVNPSDRYSLLGRCDTCDELGLSLNYNWSLSYLDPVTQAYLTLTNLSSIAAETGVLGRSISLMEHTLLPGAKFRIKLEGTAHWCSPTYTLLEFSTTMPPYGGNCSVSPDTGTAMETSFTVTCTGWLNPDTMTQAGLLYKVSSYQGSNAPALLHTSVDPVTHGLVFGPGDATNSYIQNILVDVANDIGAFTRTYLTIEVYPLQLSTDAMSQFLQSASTDLSTLMTSGNVQAGRQIAVALAGTLNADIVSGNSSIGNVSASNVTGASDKTREREQLRDTLTAAITSAPSHTMDAILQSSSTLAAITQQTQEVTSGSQSSTMSYVRDMANTLNKFTSGLNGNKPTLQDTVESATGLISSITNVGTAAKSAYSATVSAVSAVLAVHNGSLSYDYYNYDTSDVLSTLSHLSTTTESPTTMSVIATTAAALAEASEQVRSLTNGMMSVTDSVANSLLANQVPGQAPVVITTDSLQLKAGRLLAETLTNSSTSTNSGTFKMPSLSAITGNSTVDFIDQKVSACPDNPFVWDKSASKLTSPVLSLSLGNGNGSDMAVHDLNEDFVIDLNIAPELAPEKVTIQPVVNVQNKTWGTVHSIAVTDPYNAIYFVLSPSNKTSKYTVLLGYEFKPTEDEYNMTFTIPRDRSIPNNGMLLTAEQLHSVLLTPEQLYGAGVYHLMVMEQVNISFDYVLPEYEHGLVTDAPEVEITLSPALSEDYLFGDQKLDPWYQVVPDVQELTLNNYSMQLVTPSCKYWNIAAESWDSGGCRVGEGTSLSTVRCLCNHLTSFGSQFFVPPNTIDFGTVFNNLAGKLADNYAVLVTICVLLGAYILIGVWARYKDKQDVKKWGITPLVDNLDGEKYLYLITVSTGIQGKAGTTSNIFFNLAGVRDETGVRKLTDGKRKLLSRGSQVTYVATTENLLGRLQTLRIWHDNSGKGDDASWFLERFTVADLQTGRTYVFIANDWLAVDVGDGQIDRMVSVASPTDLTSFMNLFPSHSKKKLTDGHLWLSVFVRPYQSTYTRLQRLSVVMSATFLTMVVNAMFYGTEPPNTTKIYIGFITLNSFQIYVSIMGTIIVIPPSVLMDQIFRKARPKPTKTGLLITDTIDKQQNKELKQEESEGGEGSKEEQDQDVDYTSSEIDSEDDEIIRKKKHLRQKMKKKKKKTYPWWTILFGWALVFLAIGASAFFVFMYSIQWGKEKSNNWLISMWLSVLQSVLIVQPLKVFILAAIVAILLKKPDVEELTEEERNINAHGTSDETVVVDMPALRKRENIELKPFNRRKLERIRRKRLREVEMLRLVKDIIIFSIYLMFLLFLAQQNTNPDGFWINQNINKLLQEDLDGPPQPEQINQAHQFFPWLRNRIVGSSYWTQEDNDEVVTWRNKPFMVDMVSFRIGAIRLRQLRVRPDACEPQPFMANVTPYCLAEYCPDDEDRERYQAGWRPAGNATTHANSPWVYRSSKKLKEQSAGGYSGGGFTVDLTGTKEDAYRVLDHLEENAWLDLYTRALFVEMGVLNPYVNLFASVRILVEFYNSGYMTRDYRVDTFQLYSYVGPGAAWTIFCEAVVVAFIIFFLIKIIRQIKKAGWKYVKSFWNFMEVVKVIFSIVAIVMYLMKNAYVNIALRDIAERQGEFMNFSTLASWCKTYVMLIGLVCFISILECLNLLRFNVKMSMLARTLRTCAKDLSIFFVTFFVTYMAFVQFAFMAFSSTMDIYITFERTMESMVGHLLGAIDFMDMFSKHGYFGVMFYVVYILLMVFIVLSMFFAIIGDAFEATREEIANEENEYELLEFLLQIICSFMGWREQRGASGDDSDSDDDTDEDEANDEELTEEQKERKERRRKKKEKALEAEELAARDALMPSKLEEAPPPAEYVAPSKPDMKVLPALPQGPPKDLPVSSLKPLTYVPGQSPRSPVAGRGFLPNRPALPAIKSSPGVVDPMLPAYSALAWDSFPQPLSDDLPPPSFCYDPPDDEDDDPPELPGSTMTDRPMDFMHLAPLPDHAALYGNAWQLFFGRTSLRPIESIAPVVAKKPEALPALQTDSVLCRLEDIEARLTRMMED